MKYRGKKIEGVPRKIIPVIREDGNIIVIVKGIADYSPFFAICPAPEPPVVRIPGPGNKTRQNYDDKNFQDEWLKWSKKKAAWAAIHCLAETEFEWETIDLNNPETFENWQTELMSAGFTDAELNRIGLAMSEVNGLNEALIDEARQSFLIEQAALQSKPSSQTAVVNNT